MIKKENREGECYWYWSSPVEGLSIEDCEVIVQESITEKENQETDKKFNVVVFS